MTVRVGLAALAAAVLLAGCGAVPAAPRSSGAYEQCDSEALPAAREAIARGDDAAAIPALRRLVAECPDYVRGHLLYQQEAARLGGEAEAEMRSFYSALPDRPGSPVGPFVRAMLAPSDAERLALLDVALERDRSFHFGYVERAKLWEANDRISSALENYEQAVAAKPDHPEANLGLARVLEQLGRAEEAERHYRTYVQVRPGDRSAKKDYARLLIYSLRDVRQAEPVLADLERDDPSDPEVLMDQAAVAWIDGRFADAARLYHRVLELDPNDARAVYNLGNLWFRSEDRRDAARDADWRRAHAAYRYFLALDEAHDLYDLLAQLAVVPYRLEVIEAALGPIDGADPPSLSDF